MNPELKSKFVAALRSGKYMTGAEVETTFDFTPWTDAIHGIQDSLKPKLPYYNYCLVSIGFGVLGVVTVSDESASLHYLRDCELDDDPIYWDGGCWCAGDLKLGAVVTPNASLRVIESSIQMLYDKADAFGLWLPGYIRSAMIIRRLLS